MRATRLDTIIPDLLLPNPSEQHVRDFVYVCRNIAMSYLQTKMNVGKLDPHHFGISLGDMALDCIAPLFERDAHGRFVELGCYYDKCDWRKMSAEELMSTTRRLIFSTVSQELFRIYGEHDPSLSRLIRNIKNGVRASKKLVLVDRNNDAWVRLVPSFRRSDALPILPAEIIEARLFAHTGHQHSLRHILDLFAEILREQDFYQKQYPLVGIAVIVRSIMSRTAWTSVFSGEEQENISNEEICDFIESSIKKTKEVLSATYIGNGKLSEETFGLYIECVAEILKAEYASNDGANLSYFDVLHQRIPSMKFEEYRQHHRMYIEYLAKLTRVDFLEAVKREFMSQP